VVALSVSRAYCCSSALTVPLRQFCATVCDRASGKNVLYSFTDSVEYRLGYGFSCGLWYFETSGHVRVHGPGEQHRLTRECHPSSKGAFCCVKGLDAPASRNWARLLRPVFDLAGVYMDERCKYSALGREVHDRRTG
jgi:hypothetical protein